MKSSANAFGLSINPAIDRDGRHKARIDFDPYIEGSIGQIVDAWEPFVLAMNSVNRAMGRPDLYPFVLSPPVIVKLAFIHDRIHAQRGRRAAPDGDLKAVIAGLKRKVGSVDAP